MSHNSVSAIFALGILFLAIALFVPTLIDATQEVAKTSTEIDNETSEELTDYLEVEVDRVNETGDEANVTVRDLTSLETNQTLVNATETESVDLSDDTITLRLDAVVDSDTARLTVSYPPMFGWESGPRTFMENMDIIFAIIGSLLLVVGMLMGMGI